jgi:hypothetical protein
MFDSDGLSVGFNELGAEAAQIISKRPRDPNQLGKLIIDIAAGEVEDRPPTPEEQGKDPAAVAWARKAAKRARKAFLPSSARR